MSPETMSSPFKDPQKKQIGRRRFMLAAGLDLWFFHFLSSVFLFFPVALLKKLLNQVATYTGTAITTANLSSAINWRLPLILGLLAAISLFYVGTEIFAQIFFCSDILERHKTGFFREVKKGFAAIPRFLNPKGILMILFVLIAVPIVGIGFSVSLTESFYIPRFITSVIVGTPLYGILFAILLLLLALFAFQSAFVFHAVLIDRMPPGEALRHSRRIMRENRKDFLKRTGILVLISFLVLFFSGLLVQVIPELFLNWKGETLPVGHRPDLQALVDGHASDLDKEIFLYRVAAGIFVIDANYTMFVIGSVLSACFMFHMTSLYYEYTGREKQDYERESAWKRGLVLFVRFVMVYLVVTAAGSLLGLGLDSLRFDPVPITAHRTGGYLASENSLEGIDCAAALGCYGSETDIQRTKDGAYVINHDNSFKRLTGDPRKPGDMTLEEIKQLRIKDTTGSGALLPVPTMEELLDRGKGKITLFLELKGVSADRQMADDIIRAVRERNMADQVVLISLNYKVLSYIEDNYPDIETGVLIFSAIGDVSKLNVDMIIMEEEMSTPLNIQRIHDAGKKVGVWTVNTREALYHFLDTDADTVITDTVDLAMEVEKQLEERTDLQRIKDAVYRIL